MGRQSRERREARQARALGLPSPSGIRRGARLQARGEQVGQTLDDYSRAAASGGHALIRQRLLATFNVRMSRCGRLSEPYLVECWQSLRSLTVLYHGLNQLNCDFDRHTASLAGAWVDQLRWGADSVQQSVRLLLGGQLVGAALIARNQLERWTENRAFNNGIQRLDHESFESFVGRAWGPSAFGTVWRSSQESEYPDAVLYASELTRIVHAKAPVEGLAWECRGLEGHSEAACDVAKSVSATLEMVVEQLTECIAGELAEAGMPSLAQSVARLRPDNPRYGIIMMPPAIWPADIRLVNGPAARQVHELGADFDAVLHGEVPAGRLFNDAELAAACFGYFRSRSIRDSANAFAAEAEVMGPRSQHDLAPMEYPTVTTAEMAAALAQWLPQNDPKRAASLAISQSLRSAYWLWLEDDSRAMAALRVTLEQLARLRVWRLKPTQSPRLEEFSNPVRWLEKAGLSRVSALNRALGELSHFRPNVKWGAALDLLTQLNVGFSPDEAPLTARRHALVVVTRLASVEVRASVRELDAKVADAFDAIAREVGSGGEEVESQISEFMDHALTYRNEHFSEVSEWTREAAE